MIDPVIHPSCFGEIRHQQFTNTFGTDTKDSTFRPLASFVCRTSVPLLGRSEGFKQGIS
jgi:hypothetical protein